MPALADLLGRITDRPYGVPPVQIAGYVLTILGIPLIAGVLVGMVWPGAVRLSSSLSRIAVVVSAIGLIGELVSALPKVWDLIGAGTLLGMLLFNVASLAVGHLVGGPDRDREVVLALSSATRHPAIALTIATANYPGERFSAAILLCLIINALVCGPYLTWQRRHAAQAGSSRGSSTPESRPDGAS